MLRYPRGAEAPLSDRGIFVRALLIAIGASWPATAQPNAAGDDVVDPWRAHTKPLPHRMLLDLEDPWADETPGFKYASSDLVDPWNPDRAKTKTPKKHTPPVIEVIDPWTVDASERSVPTATYPIIDPWQPRPPAPDSSMPSTKRRVPTAKFPR